MSRAAKADVKVSEAAAADSQADIVKEQAESAPEESKQPKAASPAKSAKKEVRAKVYFGDALTGKNYQAGEIIEGWDDERVALYAERGLVVVSINVGPSEFK